MEINSSKFLGEMFLIPLGHGAGEDLFHRLIANQFLMSGYWPKAVWRFWEKAKWKLNESLNEEGAGGKQLARCSSIHEGSVQHETETSFL